MLSQYFPGQIFFYALQYIITALGESDAFLEITFASFWADRNNEKLFLSVLDLLQIQGALGRNLFCKTVSTVTSY